VTVSAAPSVSAAAVKAPSSDAGCAQAATHWKSVEAINTLASTALSQLRLCRTGKNENRSDEEVTAFGESLRGGTFTIGAKPAS
jgi:hypothetical protein